MPDNRNLGEILHDVFEERIGEVCTAIPGEVVSWSRSLETVTVKPVVKDSDGNPLPNVAGAKVCFPGVYWDLQAGETGVLIFSMFDFEGWWKNGRIEEPENLDTHDYGQAVFLPGMQRKATSRSVPSGATVLAGGDVRLGEDSALQPVIRGNTFKTGLDTFLTSLKAAGNIAAVVAAATAFETYLGLNDILSDKVSVD